MTYNEILENGNYWQLLACEIMQNNTFGNRVSNLALIKAGCVDLTEEACLVWC
jgi:hypothetical protein